jgi:hypothetical protein
MSRYELDLDDDVRTALRRLSVADERTSAGVIRYLIKQEATRRGLWTPSQPRLVPSSIPEKPRSQSG